MLFGGRMQQLCSQSSSRCYARLPVRGCDIAGDEQWSYNAVSSELYYEETVGAL